MGSMLWTRWMVVRHAYARKALQSAKEMKMYLMYFSALLRRFVKNEEAASGIEYAIIVAMVAVVIAGFITGIGGNIKTIFTGIESALK
ncbi:Flp family type IVb pilin [Pseudomonas sp. NPDC090202]|uniref:Flp family type IVb pilin n=1 Tax=unclassified Pseudomonas TaxID=196821 RepID=UPI0037FE8659